MILILFLFWAFFLSNLLGYGGGPASIPLNYEEIVNHFHWMTNEGFSHMLALANARLWRRGLARLYRGTACNCPAVRCWADFIAQAH